MYLSERAIVSGPDFLLNKSNLPGTPTWRSRLCYEPNAYDNQKNWLSASLALYTGGR